MCLEFFIGLDEGIDLPFYVKVGYKKVKKLNYQPLNSDGFNRTPVKIAQYIVATEKKPDACLNSI